MRFLYLNHGRAVTEEMDGLNSPTIEALVGGPFEGVTIVSPDPTVAEAEQRLILYHHSEARRVHRDRPNIRLGSGGHVIYGPALLMGIQGDRHRGLTDREIAGIQIRQVRPPELPTLEVHPNR